LLLKQRDEWRCMALLGCIEPVMRADKGKLAQLRVNTCPPTLRQPFSISISISTSIIISIITTAAAAAANHTNGRCTPDNLFSILQLFANRYQRPLWLTEFDCK